MRFVVAEFSYFDAELKLKIIDAPTAKDAMVKYLEALDGDTSWVKRDLINLSFVGIKTYLQDCDIEINVIEI